jgi:holo-[acyl-carrier protein] synthase
MMLGIGTDIVEVERIASSVERFGERFLKRILRPDEIAYCQSYRHAAPHIAARFAAKEAISKAFGTGIGEQLGWQDMEIRRLESGEPRVLLHDNGLVLLERRGGKQVLITLSHTRIYATAVAVLE